MRTQATVLPLFLAALGGCFISPTPDAGPACATTACGCFEKKSMVFTGQVFDNATSECLRGKLVRLRDRDGTVRSENNTTSAGTYRLSGEVERSATCVGGEPTIRDDPEGGQVTPTYTYLPRRQADMGTSQQVDLLRVPWGVTDAGTGQPALCIPPAYDGGTGLDGG